MPENKNQHYVPKFYLRLFSNDGKQIESYNLKRKQSFTTSLNHLCAKNYFYGKDGDVEKSFSQLESKQSSVLGSIIRTQTIPGNFKDYNMMHSFICLQHARTEATKIKANESMKLLSDEIVESVVGKDSGCEIVHPGIHLLKMQFALQSIPLIGDLMPVILINETQKNFIFSDNPIVFHNTYFNKIENMGTHGLQSPGLQIFCPLSDKIMLMLYDPKYYSINIGTSYSLKISNENDVDAINKLQFLNCNENIFYAQKSQENEVKRLHNEIQPLIGQNKMKKNIIRTIESIDKKKELVHFYEDRPMYDLNLSFVGLIDNEPIFDIVRNPKLVDRIKNDIDTYDRFQSSTLGRLFYKILMNIKHVKYSILLQLYRIGQAK